jgi:CelD/BcsL family acetyltransferase involved in cellulose biosynthesis
VLVNPLERRLIETSETPTIDATGITCIVYRRLDELEELRPAWERLQQAVPSAAIFTTWEWLSAWWHAFGDKCELFTFASFDPNGELIGLAPLSLKMYRTHFGLNYRMLSFMADGSGDSDNLDFLVLPGREQMFVSALLDYLLTNKATWDFARFNTLPDDSPTAAALGAELTQRHWVWFQEQKPRTFIDLPNDWETFRKQMSYNERGQLGKYIRRVERNYKVTVRKCVTETQLQSDLTVFFDLHSRRWEAVGKPGSFSSSARRSFYKELSSLTLSRQWLEFWMLELNGEPVASEFGVRYRDTVYSLQVGNNPEHSADRVGYVLRGYLLQQLIKEGLHRYDFMGGGESYKDRWASTQTRYLNFDFARPMSFAAGYLRTVHAGYKLKEWVRRHAPASVWNIGKRLYCIGRKQG